MRHLVSCCCAVVLIGCAKSEEQPARDTTAAAPARPATISLGDVAGKWAVRNMTESGDSTLVRFEMVATANTSGWAFNFADVGSQVFVLGTDAQTDRILVRLLPGEHPGSQLGPIAFPRLI